ncbi:MAG: hypothetical protein Q9P44_15170 [Anaerolineae bacterium]|nr:hypothetical protein [Anaerolineae bacterium]
MTVDLWGWFHASLHNARMNGDTERQKYNEFAYRGWAYRRTAQPDEAFMVFEQGETLAKKLGDPCWELFFQYWCAEMLFYHKVDQQAALDYAIRVATRAYKEQYLGCPIRSRVYFVIADIYYAIDFFSYQDKIRDMLDYLQNDVPMDHDTDLRARHMRAEFEMEFDRFDVAKSLVEQYMPDAQGNDFRMRSGYNMLRRIAYAKGYVQMALDYSLETEKYAIHTQSQGIIASQKLWQAVYHKRLGNDTIARICHLNGIDLHERYALPSWPGYYDSLCEYLEVNGEVDRALAIRKKQLEEMETHHSIYNESVSHLDYCRLLGRLGKPIDKALKIARDISQRMSNPDLFLSRLQKIQDGDYYDFSWQRDNPAGTNP